MKLLIGLFRTWRTLPIMLLTPPQMSMILLGSSAACAKQNKCLYKPMCFSKWPDLAFLIFINLFWHFLGDPIAQTTFTGPTLWTRKKIEFAFVLLTNKIKRKRSFLAKIGTTCKIKRQKFCTKKNFHLTLSLKFGKKKVSWAKIIFEDWKSNQKLKKTC